MQPADESPKRVSTKLDGVYARATAAGIESKSGKLLDLPHIHARLARHFRKHPDGELKGELFRPGAGVEKIAGEVKSGGSVAKGLRMHLFPDQGPRPLPVGAVRRVHAQTAKTAGDVDRIYQKAVKRGEEGVMIRHPDGTIEKRKPRDTSEHVVTRASVGPRGVMEVATAGGRTFKVQGREGLVAKQGDRVQVSYSGAMERVDAQGHVVGFSIMGVSQFRKDKPLEAELVSA